MHLPLFDGPNDLHGRCNSGRSAPVSGRICGLSSPSSWDGGWWTAQGSDWVVVRDEGMEQAARRSSHDRHLASRTCGMHLGWSRAD